jgi:hypothetical protein
MFGSLLLSFGTPSGGTIKLFHTRNTAFRDYLNVLGGIDAFSETSFSERLKLAWEKLKYKFASTFNPRNLIMNLSGGPIGRVIGVINANFFQE